MLFSALQRFAARLMTLLFVPALAGCLNPTTGTDQANREQALTLLMPSRIEIVEPFTRVKSFDQDVAPDGIELLLQAVNSLENPGLMIVGALQVELYQHVPASANQKGRRLEHWNVTLSSAEDQRMHWNQLTQMYEFRLGIDPGALPLDDKYVLAVTYNSPLGEHLMDEVVLSRPLGPRPVTTTELGMPRLGG